MDKNLNAAENQNLNAAEIENDSAERSLTNKERRLLLYSQRTGLTLEEIKRRNLSNGELKRIVKRKRWEESKNERRTITKNKRRKKTNDNDNNNYKTATKSIRYSMKESENKLRIAIDYSFENLMNDKELRKLLKQTQRIYSFNRQYEHPCQLYLTGLSEQFNQLAEKRLNISKWDVNLSEKHFLNLFQETEKTNIVYLSSDSTNVLPDEKTFRSNSERNVYIIGGLVDHNVYKNRTFELANEASISHARLPIPEYVKVKIKNVLTVNQVFEILMSISSGASWSETLNDIVPKRKIISRKERKKLKQNDDDDDDGEENDDDDDGEENDDDERKEMDDNQATAKTKTEPDDSDSEKDVNDDDKNEDDDDDSEDDDKNDVELKEVKKEC